MMPGPTEVHDIPYTRRVIYTTYAGFPSTGLRIGDLAYATDRLVFYRWNGAAWQAVTIHSSSGLAAAIPTAADLPNGSLYFETDTSLTKQVQAGAWGTISGGPIASGVIAMWHGLIANIPAGWVLCDGGSSSPDLRERFAQGAPAATEAGTTGGATGKTTGGHQHTSAAHSHTITGGASTLANGAEAPCVPNSTNSATPGLTGSQTDGIADIRPKYYTVQFIMKT